MDTRHPWGRTSEGQRSSECLALREEVANDDARVSSGERCCRRIRVQYVAESVAPAERGGVVCDWRAVDLEDVVDEVHDPIVRHSRARVEAAFVDAIERQPRAGRGHLNDQHRACRMPPTVVTTPAWYYGNIRFRLRLVVQRDWPLRSRQPSRTERRPQGVFRQPDGRVMGAPLRFANDQLAPEELDAFVLVENAECRSCGRTRPGSIVACGPDTS
jgi:hypothetical protein